MTKTFSDCYKSQSMISRVRNMRENVTAMAKDMVKVKYRFLMAIRTREDTSMVKNMCMVLIALGTMLDMLVSTPEDKDTDMGHSGIQVTTLNLGFMQ